MTELEAALDPRHVAPLNSDQECWDRVSLSGHLSCNGWSASATEPLTCACGQVLGGVLLYDQQATYAHQAQVVMQVVEEYEEVHPKGAPCFQYALEAMRQAVTA